MTHEQLLAQARKHMWAAWALSSEELGSQAAETLFGLGMLVPEGGAQELKRLRARVAELEAEKHAAHTEQLATMLAARTQGPMAAEGETPYESRLLPPGDAVCARPDCGHPGEDHHHGDTKCWAHLPKRHGDPVTICPCPGFVPAPAVEESADRLTALFAPTQVLGEDPHDSPLHHTYQLGRDLPETGGA